MSRSLGNRTGGNYPSPPSSLPPRSSLVTVRKSERSESAIDDDQNDEDDKDSAFTKSRTRRASEGQHLMKGDSKKINPNDLKCEKCGKGYKHSSCLTKHLWEHTPEWSVTSKLLISKHQQVQLLEAASVLVAMNQDADTPPGSAKDFTSDQDSNSPSASGSSGHRDGLSSTDTTPPPQTEGQHESYAGSNYSGRPKRYSSGSNFSRSYQSAPSSNPLHNGSAPNGSGFGHYRQQSHDRRPLSSGISVGAQDDAAGLAAAVELLSCSFGTPRTGPVTLPPDVPPVPPLPAQYLSQSAFSGNNLTPARHSHQAAESYTRHTSADMVRDNSRMDVDESGAESVMDDEDYDSRSRGRSDEDDDGVFGRMEEE